MDNKEKSVLVGAAVATLGALAYYLTPRVG